MLDEAARLQQGQVDGEGRHAASELGAEDVQSAFDRACLQGRIGTARHLYAMGARPGHGAVMGCAEGTVKSTLSDARARLRTALEVSG